MKINNSNIHFGKIVQIETPQNQDKKTSANLLCNTMGTYCEITTPGTPQIIKKILRIFDDAMHINKNTYTLKTFCINDDVYIVSGKDCEELQKLQDAYNFEISQVPKNQQIKATVILLDFQKRLKEYIKEKQEAFALFLEITNTGEIKFKKVKNQQ